MDLSQLVNAAGEVILGGDPYPVRALTFAEWGDVQAYLKRTAPSPLQRVAIAAARAQMAGEPLDDATFERLYTRAEQAETAWPPQIGTETWFTVLDRIPGADAELVYQVLRRTVPGLDRDRAAQICATATASEYWRLLYWAMWGEPPAVESPKKDEDASPPAGTTRRMPRRPTATSGAAKRGTSSRSRKSGPGKSAT